jgi:hypothetical protein
MDQHDKNGARAHKQEHRRRSFRAAMLLNQNGAENAARIC